jgi:tetratricopeptide (TPR) repeat protein
MGAKFRWPLRVLVVVLTMAGASFMVRAVRAGSETDTAKIERHAYSERVAATYNSRFGSGHFLPSNATTDDGEFIDPKSFLTAKYCGHCHQEAYAQWRQSAHSNSNRPPWYLRNVGLLDTGKGIEYSRHCEGCHDPVALFAGALTEHGPGRKSYDDDGVTCETCHSITSVTTRGTGSYVMGTPAVLVDENGQPITRPVSDAEILAHLDRHSKAVMRDIYHSSEFCAACHEAALPHMLNDYKWQRAISLYDEWQASSFAKQSPLPFYVKDSVSTCQTCHMPREVLELKDQGAKQGKLASHRWLGANTVIPQYYGFDEQLRRTEQFLQNNVFNVDLFAVEHGDGRNSSNPANVSAPLGVVDYHVAPGEQLTVDVVIQNKGIGHSHVPEQRDMYESWVDFTIKDSSGKILCESGFLKPNGDLDSNAHSFTNRLISPQGTLNTLHEVWNTRIVAYNNTIQSGRAQVVRYSFQMPSGATDAVTLTATVKYRRFDQVFMDFGMAKHYIEPVVEMASASRVIRVGDNPPTPPTKGENPEWMRWNNYGIGLLDAQQYAASYDAFRHVAKLRPDYADAYTNMAIVDIQWERYDDARPNLAKALELSPQNARALYYRALVERNKGELDKTIADLEEVAKEFPLSRDAHRELGFTFYQLHRYPEALKQYEALQEIAPDDLAAHYNLAILYRRLGVRDKSLREAKEFAEQKDDPTANTYALEFLRNHPELANESVPWHTHELVMPQTSASTSAASGSEGHAR